MAQALKSFAELKAQWPKVPPPVKTAPKAPAVQPWEPVTVPVFIDQPTNGDQCCLLARLDHMTVDDNGNPIPMPPVVPKIVQAEKALAKFRRNAPRKAVVTAVKKTRRYVTAAVKRGNVRKSVKTLTLTAAQGGENPVHGIVQEMRDAGYKNFEVHIETPMDKLTGVKALKAALKRTRGKQAVEAARVRARQIATSRAQAVDAALKLKKSPVKWVRNRLGIQAPVVVEEQKASRSKQAKLVASMEQSKRLLAQYGNDPSVLKRYSEAFVALEVARRRRSLRRKLLAAAAQSKKARKAVAKLIASHQRYSA